MTRTATPPRNRNFRLPTTFFRTRYPDLGFWLSFLLLNFLLFAPLYLLNREITNFLPLPNLADQNPLQAARHVAVWRNNLDIFRLNLELLLLVSLVVVLTRAERAGPSRFFRILLVFVYLAALIYAVYESVTLSLYQVDPVFFNQFKLAIDGLRLVSRHLHVSLGFYAIATVAVVALIFLVVRTIGFMLNESRLQSLSKWSLAGLSVLVVLTVAFAGRYRADLASPKMAINSLVSKLQTNIILSLQEQRKIAAMDPSTIGATYDYSGHDLIEKPNIYLIFVESYGSVLYKRDWFRDAYRALLPELDNEFKDHGWHVTSALSEAPTWGGGSWMSYTSALFGLRIETHPQYLSLQDLYQDRDYPDLARTLQDQGYRYVHVSSISTELREEQWQKHTNFYGVDEWLRFEDMDYGGATYGWGPAPPDQYVLNHAYYNLVRNAVQPILLFFITQNSHYPWTPLPELATDWRSIDDGSGQELSAPAPGSVPLPALRKHYLRSIEYELISLTDFILESGDDQAIYVLIGDHQPQQVSRHNDGFDTPVHIVSKNPALINAFARYGFEPGLTVSNLMPTIRHEGFYSMFMRVLLTEYGQGTRKLPPYLPDGLILENETRLN
ncbi:MAG: hypothetical protein U9R25_09860 [Chloroflexota bacterium]|nr:hypothetical protein [Chloroflexota bacterium]